MVFTDTDRLAGTDAEDADIPDPLVGGRIDFGALTAEFLALGLDPYPRKPGIAFEPVVAGEERDPWPGCASSATATGWRRRLRTATASIA